MPHENPDPRSLLPLPHLEYQTLVSLADADLHGYAIVKQVAERSQGTSAPSTGSLYLAIARLLKHGLIDEVTDANSGGRNKRTYALSGFGRSVAEAETTRLGELARLAHDRLRGSAPAANGSRGQR
jgi:DNA-binding PadR family transcriptional regulator